MKKERMVIFYAWCNRITVNERQYDNVSLPSRKRVKRVCGKMACDDSFFQGGCAWRIPSSAAEHNDVFKSLTDEWVELFSDEKNQNGFMWRAAGKYLLPKGVDPCDRRVIALCEKAKTIKEE